MTLTTSDERGGNHVRGRLRIQAEGIGEDDRWRDETREHREGMLETAGEREQNRQIRVECVERGHGLLLPAAAHGAW